MTTLPAQPDLDQLRRQAKEVLRAVRDGDGAAYKQIEAVSDRLTLAAHSSRSPGATGFRAGSG
jgi:hypothetical protein